ncbi:hypothetical protein SLEP1_g38424 [Rubroshorea leprosula]|nr:hypothetical protein SLEP1_g38424 [Rubroshorea leprosula]
MTQLCQQILVTGAADQLTQFGNEHFFDTVEGYMKDIGSVLELFKASEIVYLDDTFWGDIRLNRATLNVALDVSTELSNGSVCADRVGVCIRQQVDYVLEFPYHAKVERFAHRRYVEQYGGDCTGVLKNFILASNMCQSIHREELKHLERWVVEKILDKLKFARQRELYFSVAAILFSPGQSDACMSWVKNCVLATVVDDLFDVGGSEEELWLDVLKGMLLEAMWLRNNSAPTLDVYMATAHKTLVLGPVVLPILYFLGHKLSEETV